LLAVLSCEERKKEHNEIRTLYTERGAREQELKTIRNHLSNAQDESKRYCARIRYLNVELTTSWDMYRTQANQHTKAISKIDELERQMKDLNKENKDLSSANAAVQAKFEQLKGYKDGYPQLRSELDELEAKHTALKVICKDLEFECDELKKKLPALEDADTVVSQAEPNVPVPEPSYVEQPQTDNPTTDIQRLNDRVQHLQGRIELKQTSKEKKEAEIVLLNSQIDEARRQLKPTSKLSAPTAAQPPPTIDVGQIEPLDVGEVSLEQLRMKQDMQTNQRSYADTVQRQAKASLPPKELTAQFQMVSQEDPTAPAQEETGGTPWQGVPSKKRGNKQGRRPGQGHGTHG
jgi:DNA repair exonuclease SbcCD ATPase subunit